MKQREWALVLAGQDNSTVERYKIALEAVSSEYNNERDNHPWIVAYSGGKDSSLLLHAVFDAALKSSSQQRQVHIVANDTLVESPPIIAHLRESIALIRKAIRKFSLPMTAVITRPNVDDTFWVNVIGRGYIPPTRNFRWCTDRMKIEPTNNYISKIAATGKAILLIGTRKSESQSRRIRMEGRKVTATTMSQHSSIPGCKIFSPLADLTDNDVWSILLQNKPLWGGTYRKLVTLYRNAGGGECPLVLTKEDAPSCGTTSPRFGCWTCTVIQKDRSLAGLIDSGAEELEALQDFREWLVSLRDNDDNRMPHRRNGRIKLRADGSRVRGPFTMPVRRRILNELKSLEESTGRMLLSRAEISMIKDIWRRDDAKYRCKEALNSMLHTRSVSARGQA